MVKKFLALLIMASVCTILLAACGSSSSDSRSPVPGMSEEEYEYAKQVIIDADREWRDENLF